MQCCMNIMKITYKHFSILKVCVQSSIFTISFQIPVAVFPRFGFAYLISRQKKIHEKFIFVSKINITFVIKCENIANMGFENYLRDKEILHPLQSLSQKDWYLQCLLFVAQRQSSGQRCIDFLVLNIIIKFTVCFQIFLYKNY